MCIRKKHFAAFCCALAFTNGMAQMYAPTKATNRGGVTDVAKEHTRPAWAKSVITKSEASPSIYNVKDGESRIYAQLRYDTKLNTTGLASFSTFAPDSYSLIRDYGYTAGKTSILTSGTYVGDEFIAYETVYYTNVLMPEAISVVDVNTGEYKRKKTIESDGSTPLIIDEMTYDPKSDRIYAMHYDSENNTTDIYEIDKTSLEIKKVARLDLAMYTLSADDGFLYGVFYDGKSSKLAKIEESSIDAGKQTAKLQIVSPASGTGIAIGDYSQSMEFDKTTHRLWWVAQTSDDSVFLVELDPQTGIAVSKKEIAGYPQFLAMGIPYQFVPDAAPSYPRNFTVTVGEKGAMSANLSWTSPNENYRNGALNSLSGIKIYRNGELIKDISETATSGKAMTWTDTPTADGYYIYKVVPYNGEGDGVYKEDAAFVGEDLPGAPVDVKLSAVGNKATISWKAPERGKQGGYFDASSLKYNVVRMPGNVTIASGISETSTKDEVTEPNGYSYTVTAVNSKGTGGTGTSNTQAFGPASSIPFTSSLQTQEDFNRWTAVDRNKDNNTWSFKTSTETTTYDRNENAPDDWLYTPSLTFDKSKTYQIRYTYSSSNWVSAGTMEPINEKMKVWFCENPIGSGKATLIKETGEFHTASNMFLYGKDLFTPSTSGESRIAFQACSDADCGQIYLKDISIREYSAKDLSVSAVVGSTIVNSTVKQYYTVTVKNEGSQTVDKYKVRLVNDETGETITETDGKAVGVDQTVDIPVEWIPGAVGKIKVKAEVVLEGDTYPADNVSETVLDVEVKAADEDKWITVNTDNNSGWRFPFYLYDEYSKCQCLFLEKELQKKDIEITGVRFIYNNYQDEAFTFPAKISIKATDKLSLSSEDSKYLGVFEDGDWQNVFDGNVSIEGNGNDKVLAISFSKPYIYKGGNLNFMFECPMGSDIWSSSKHPEWHLAQLDMNETFRNAYYSGKTQLIPAEEVYANEFMPFMSISYKENGGTGILTVTGNKLTIRTSRNAIELSETCDAVRIVSPSGATVFNGTGVNTVNTSNLPDGIYILELTRGNNKAKYKIIIE